jgi:hypothetical protein
MFCSCVGCDAKPPGRMSDMLIKRKCCSMYAEISST